MAGTDVVVEKLGSRLAITMYDHDPANSTVATDIGWVDMQGYESFGVMVMTSVLGGTGPTVFTLVANSTAAGDGDESVIKTHAMTGATLPNAVGDYVWLETTADQVNDIGRAAGYALRYISAKLTCQHTGDECVVTYVLGRGQFPRTGLTTNYISP